MKNYYATLGITRDASDEDIKLAYRTLARRYHPDLGGEENAPRFEEINEAYRFLSDRIKRMGLDAELAASGMTANLRPHVNPQPRSRSVSPAAGSETERREQSACARPQARDCAPVDGAGYTAELEAQIAAYEAVIESLTKVSYAPPRRDLSPASLAALLRVNREKRAVLARKTTK